MSTPFILALDIGTSSLRALLFDAQARVVAGTPTRRTYEPRTTVDGGAELDAAALFEAFVAALDELLARTPDAPIATVATSSLAASVLAMDAAGRALTPAYLYADTRNAGAVEELRARCAWDEIYARTGCPLHTSYLPARLGWLRRTQPQIFARAARWVSLHEFFLLKLFGRAVISHSLAAWTGLLNRATRDWDDELLAWLGVRREQLSPVVSATTALTNLNETYQARWPGLARVPFFPALGDGAAANLGSGCVDSTRVAVTLGTSGAMRVIVRETKELGERGAIPQGLWLYYIDARRSLLGGSLNNGGNVIAYLRRALQLPEAAALERQLAALEPDAHGLTLLPFFAGERSPGYRGDARAAIVGLSLNTTPVEILRATLEAIAYRFALIYERLRQAVAAPRAIVMSGAAGLNSPAWAQLLADVLGRPLTLSGETEAAARGAALIALEALGVIADAGELAPAYGETFSPNPMHHAIYARARERQQQLYAVLVQS